MRGAVRTKCLSIKNWCPDEYAVHIQLHLNNLQWMHLIVFHFMRGIMETYAAHDAAIPAAILFRNLLLFSIKIHIPNDEIRCKAPIPSA